MIATLPDKVQTKRMPPLTRRSATLDMLVPSDRPTDGYMSVRQLNDRLIDSNERLYRCAVAAFPLGCVVGGLLMLWAVKG